MNVFPSFSFVRFPLTFVAVLAMAVPAFALLPIPTRPTSFPLQEPQVVSGVGAWGANWYGQTTVPFGLSNVVQVAAGGDHTVALKSDGSVLAWGSNEYGQSTVPSELTNVVQAAAGGYLTVALKSDGTVVTWGDDSQGQATVPPGLSNVVQVAVGSWHAVALKSDGTVVAWGDDWDGQTTVPSGLSDVVQVAAGGFHTVALKGDGTVVAWGADWLGQTTVPSGLSNVVQVAAGGYHTVALKSDGSVVAWGADWTDQTTVPFGLSDVIQVAAGGFHTVALKSDGSVVAWGSNEDGATAVPPGPNNAVQVAAGVYHTVALGNFPPEIVSSIGDTRFPLGQYYSVQLVVQSGTPPFTWQVVAGSLPPGLALASDGTISGVPTISGSFEITAQVTDAEARSTSKSFSWSMRLIPESSSGGGFQFSDFAGSAFFSGSADGTGTSAEFSSPSGVAVDASGNIYVADSGNDLIRKVSSSGDVTTVAGGFTGSADGTGAGAQFDNPQGIAVGPDGNLYVAESDSHLIRKVTPSGDVSAFSGSAGFLGSADGSAATARFNQPSDVAVDASGNIYVADSGNHAIRKIATNGTVSTLAGTKSVSGNQNGSGSAAKFRSPQGVAVDSSGNVYVADTGNCLIRKITASGDVTTFVGAAFTGSADDIGRFTGSADLSGTQPSVDGTGTGASFSFPTDLEVDNFGNLYVTDSGTGKIRKITSAGVVTTLGGTPDGFFYNPLAIAVEPSGKLYVADTGDNRIALGVESSLQITTTSPLAAGAVGAGYSQTLTASGGVTPYTWSLAVGSILPAGLSLSESGVITGIPTVAGISNFTIQVAGADELYSTADFTLTITSPFATWQESRFTPTEIANGLTGLTQDFDGDGVPNLLEYAFGTDPKVSDPTAITQNVSGNKMQISFSCDASRTDITYTVQASSTLAAGSWTDIANSAGGAAAVPVGSVSTVSDTGTGLRTVTVTDSTVLPAGGKRFLRVKVTGP